MKALFLSPVLILFSSFLNAGIPTELCKADAMRAGVKQSLAAWDPANLSGMQTNNVEGVSFSINNFWVETPAQNDGIETYFGSVEIVTNGMPEIQSINVKVTAVKGASAPSTCRSTAERL